MLRLTSIKEIFYQNDLNLMTFMNSNDASYESKTQKNITLEHYRHKFTSRNNVSDLI